MEGVNTTLRMQTNLTPIISMAFMSFLIETLCQRRLLFLVYNIPKNETNTSSQYVPLPYIEENSLIKVTLHRLNRIT